jgi:hypothetical protein
MAAEQELRGAVLEQQLDRVADQLTHKYADRADSGEVRDAVSTEASRYREARVTQYIPVLVQHAVQELLRQRGPRDPSPANPLVSQ